MAEEFVETKQRRLPMPGSKHRLILATLFVLVALPSAQADFVAFSASKGGQTLPLPKDLTNVNMKYLINVKWGKYSGNKSRIGVLPVENTSGASAMTVSGFGSTVNYNINGGGVPVQGIGAIITDVMLRTGRFRLVERKKLDQTLHEQDLGASGRIAKPSAAKIGKVLGAQYLFQAVVTNYEDGVESKGGGIGGLIGGTAGALLGGLSMKSSKAIIGMNFRMIDATTSEVIYTDQVQVDLSSSGLSFGGLGFSGGVGLGGFLSKYAKTPIGHAVIAAVNKGVFDLVKHVGSTSTTGSVIKVKGNRIYLNLGSSVVKIGDVLTLKRKGEELIDPDTGISLGGEEEVIGQVKVTTAKAKYSFAKPVGVKPSAIKRGDKVESQRAAEPLMYAKQWNPPKEESFLGSFGGKSGNSSNNGEEDSSGNR